MILQVKQSIFQYDNFGSIVICGLLQCYIHRYNDNNQRGGSTTFFFVYLSVHFWSNNNLLQHSNTNDRINCRPTPNDVNTKTKNYTTCIPLIVFTILSITMTWNADNIEEKGKKNGGFIKYRQYWPPEKKTLDVMLTTSTIDLTYMLTMLTINWACKNDNIDNILGRVILTILTINVDLKQLHWGCTKLHCLLSTIPPAQAQFLCTIFWVCVNTAVHLAGGSI